MDDVKRIVVIGGDPPHYGTSCQDGLPLTAIGFALLQKLEMVRPATKGDWTHWMLIPDLQSLDEAALLAEVVTRDNKDQMDFALDVWEEIATEEGWAPK